VVWIPREREHVVRNAILIFITGLAAFALVPVASADKPSREFTPTEDFIIEDVCAFPVEYHVLANNEFTTTFSDGRQLITGKLKVRLTNLDEPSKSLKVNISGPGVIRVTEEGVFTLKATGRWLFFFFPADLGPGEPGIHDGHDRPRRAPDRCRGLLLVLAPAGDDEGRVRRVGVAAAAASEYM
jgi:hypothetical protein